MPPHPSDDVSSPETTVDTHRGVGELLLAALAGTALAPFVQAIATKVGEDVYAKIKHLLARRRDADPATDGSITLADPTTSIVLELPATLDVQDAYKLAAVRLPSSPTATWLLVRYDTDSHKWTAVPIPSPPQSAIEVDGQQ